MRRKEKKIFMASIILKIKNTFKSHFNDCTVCTFCAENTIEWNVYRFMLFTLTLATFAVRARSAPPWIVNPHFCWRVSLSNSNVKSSFGIVFRYSFLWVLKSIRMLFYTTLVLWLHIVSFSKVKYLDEITKIEIAVKLRSTFLWNNLKNEGVNYFESYLCQSCVPISRLAVTL